MACKAHASASYFEHSTDQQIQFNLSITANGQRVDDVPFGPVAANSSDVALTNAVKAFVQDYCEENFGVEWELLDTVRIIPAFPGLLVV